MSRLGRVPPSAGRDVVDRKACFLSLPAQAAVLASIRGPACHLETCGQSNGGVRRPSPNESRMAGSGDPRRTSPQGREVAVIEKRQNEGHRPKRNRQQVDTLRLGKRCLKLWLGIASCRLLGHFGLQDFPEV